MRGLYEEVSQSVAFVIRDVGQMKRAKAAVIRRCSGGRSKTAQIFRPRAGRAKMTRAGGPAGKDRVYDCFKRACHKGSTISGVPRLTRGKLAGRAATPRAIANGDRLAEAPCPSLRKIGLPIASRLSQVTGTYSRRPIARE